MDTSKEYIEMCEKAEEIQLMKPTHFNGTKEFQPGEYFSFKDQVYLFPGNNVLPPFNSVWTPRQDQLQEMIILEKDSIYCLTETISNFNLWLHQNPKQLFTSFEQYWLGHIMYMKYNKTWNTKTRTWDLKA